jgi:hypothetical protein
MFSVLPREIIHSILNLYANTVNNKYMSLRTVNKQICAHVISSAPDYIRNHCFTNVDDWSIYNETFALELHKRLIRCNSLTFLYISLEHTYLPITITIVNSGRDCTIQNNFKLAGCHICVGNREAGFDICRNPTKKGVTLIMFAQLRYILLGDQSWVMDFLREYFIELYTYLMSIQSDSRDICGHII